MLRFLTSVAALALTSGVAAACPNGDAPGLAQFNTTGYILSGASDYSVVAGGLNSLRDCGWPHTGYTISSPDFTFQIEGLAPYTRLQFISYGNCDTVLLVQSPSGEYYFDDDTAGDGNPGVYLEGLRSGFYNVWVGTYGPDSCNATLRLQTL